MPAAEVHQDKEQEREPTRYLHLRNKGPHQKEYSNLQYPNKAPPVAPTPGVSQEQKRKMLDRVSCTKRLDVRLYVSKRENYLCRRLLVSPPPGVALTRLLMLLEDVSEEPETGLGVLRRDP